MERLSPRANGREYVEGGELATTDVGEVIPQHAFDTSKLILRQPHASRPDDPVQLALDGLTIEQLAAEQGRPVPTAS